MHGLLPNPNRNRTGLKFFHPKRQLPELNRVALPQRLWRTTNPHTIDDCPVRASPVANDPPIAIQKNLGMETTDGQIIDRDFEFCLPANAQVAR
jgi:hypothetical protein